MDALWKNCLHYSIGTKAIRTGLGSVCKQINYLTKRVSCNGSNWPGLSQGTYDLCNHEYEGKTDNSCVNALQQMFAEDALILKVNGGTKVAKEIDGLTFSHQICMGTYLPDDEYKKRKTLIENTKFWKDKLDSGESNKDIRGAYEAAMTDEKGYAAENAHYFKCDIKGGNCKGVPSTQDQGVYDVKFDLKTNQFAQQFSQSKVVPGKVSSCFAVYLKNE
jgi:hypothetical protein